ncbi:uncharacterized protein K444DRAFT_636809 [Hyaloscypha bicolor E]|uniref:Concanavalin A-like lectin/glucanase n=1 Tax=Hyaloscypha bicolor E TaxID=1095630 RepID=A0A2J6SL87_9HELO|nr:uncharacterized protein K444DRAFT_636809 [Hyaloscypha bicolor E]PMD51525.1 hypothetical protein K444DRAFT_636809 [Hyaloscypha bicolor E]
MKSTLPHLSAILLLTFASLISSTIGDIANLTFYGVWIGAGPQAIITKFESTLVLPGGSPDQSPTHDVQAFWPGMEPAKSNAVFQNVITNQGGGPGECPATNLTEQMRVWPGDTVKNVFTLDIPNGKWYNNWVVTPGEQGNAAGQQPFGGGFEFDPAFDTETKGAPYTGALLTIELQELGTWDFGSVMWQNVILEANTTETKWCTDGPSGPKNWNWTASPGTFSTSDKNLTTCYYAMIVLESPNPN